MKETCPACDGPMPCHRTHRVEDAEIVVKPPLPTLSDAQYIQAQTERIEALERELSYQLNDTEYSKRLKGLELDNERLTAEVAALRTQLDEANADADKWCRKSNGRYDEIATLRAERDIAMTQLSSTEAFLALVMRNLDGMARGQLWQEYREKFPGLHDRQVRAAIDLAREPKKSEGHNPGHAFGTCGNCGGELVYNVPRLGPFGGYVHRETRVFECGGRCSHEGKKPLQ